MKLKIMRAVNEENDLIAGEVRALLNDAGVTTFNFMSSPGSGKTSLLETTLKSLMNRLRFGVVVGDLFTTKDAERINSLNVPVVQLNTEGSCHLTAHMIRESIGEFNMDSLDCLLIENIGNLVCPGSFDLGEDYRVALVSTPEGNDKIEKYPKMFRMSSANLITKIDLAELTDFDINEAKAKLQLINPEAPVFPVSLRTNEGIQDWINWLYEMITQQKSE